jgi:hypothetical protein
MHTSTHVSFSFPTFGYVPSRTLVGIVILAARFELGRMYHTRQDADLTQQLPIATVPIPISIHNASVDAEIQKVEVATFPLSEERGVESNSSLDKADEWIMETKYGCAFGRKDGSYNPSTGTTINWSDVVAAEVNDI